MERPLGLWPACGAKETILHSNDDDAVGIYLIALGQGDDTVDRQTLQCWTNLPVKGVSEQGSDWNAIDIGDWPPHKSADGLLYKELAVRIDKHAPRQDFELTWRMKSGSGQVTWLGSFDGNAVISIQPRSTSYSALNEFVASHSDKRSKTQLAETLVFSIPISSSQSLHDVPLDYVEAGFVVERTKPTWHTARYIQSAQDVSDRFSSSLIAFAYSRSFKTGERAIVDVDLCVVRPVHSANTSISTTRKDEHLFADFRTTSKDASDVATYAHVIVAFGRRQDLHRLLEATSEEARYLMARSSLSNSTPDANSGPSPLSMDEAIGFCTWEALGTRQRRPDLSTMTRLASSMPDALPFNSILIDDGWQNVDYSHGRGRLRSFDLDASLLDGPDHEHLHHSSPFGCPRLKFLVSRFRLIRPQIQHYGVWMTMAGYWDGLDRTCDWGQKYGPLLKANLQCPLLPTGDQQKTWYLPNDSTLEEFYHDYFAALAQAGITFVKVDDQADWEWITQLSYASDDADQRSAPDPIQFFEKAWWAMKRAGDKVFGPGAILHCMALGQRFLNSSMGLDGGHGHTGALHLRTSDDTFPHVASAHTWHLYNNAVQGCLTQSIGGIVADGDMITSVMEGSSDEDWARFHLAFRICFSGATVWLSDDESGMGSSRLRSMLEAVLAPKKDATRPHGLGSSVPLKLGRRHMGTAISSCLFHDLTGDTPGRALKLACRAPFVEGGTTELVALLTVWNTRSNGQMAIDYVGLHDVSLALFQWGSKMAEKTDAQPGEQDDAHVVISSSRSRRATWVSLREIRTEYLCSNQLQTKPLLALALRPSMWDEFAIVCARTMSSPFHSKTRIACVGLADKTAGVYAVGTSKISLNANGSGQYSVTLLRAGQCAFLVHWKDDERTSDHSGSTDWDVFLFQVDDRPVSSCHVSLQRMEGEGGVTFCLTVDMVAHLLGHRQAYHKIESSWEISLQFRT